MTNDDDMRGDKERRNRSVGGGVLQSKESLVDDGNGCGYCNFYKGQAVLLLRQRTHHPLGDSIRYGRGPPPILIAPVETPPQTFLYLQGTPIFISRGGGQKQQDATA